jgi:hypothetical protein
VGKFINDHVVADLAAYCDENDQRARERGAEWVASDVLADAARHGRYWEGVSEEDVPGDYIHHFRAAQRRATVTKSDVTPEMLGIRRVAIAPVTLTPASGSRSDMKP